MTHKAKRASISIASIEIEVFQLLNEDYAMSQSQVAEAVEVHSFSISRFLKSKQAKSLLDKSFEFHTLTVEGSNKPINVISISVASAFWFTQAIKGNVKAQAISYACQIEALQRRCDTAFKAMKTEHQYEQQAITNKETWEKSREFLKDTHASFTSCCMAYNFHAGVAHDAITLAVCGKKASELRELEVISGNPSIGLNHVQDYGDLVKIAKAKLLFSKYRKGSIQERVAKVLKDIN
ncbi:hypothetical protein JYQ62_16065 [Nostoc sp. UHCC 0702]|nr:hypothetical protein JYQ62_16065 [Nostoc sp. UHCC 0702]